MPAVGDADPAHPLFPTRRRATRGLVAAGLILLLSLFLTLFGGSGDRVLASVMVVVALVFGFGWIEGLRRTRPILWITEDGLRLPSGPSLDWADIEGIVVMELAGRAFCVVAKDATRLRQLRADQRVARWLDSAMAGRPVWTHLPLASVSQEDREFIERVLSHNSIAQLSPRRGALRRVIRAFFWFLPPASGG